PLACSIKNCCSRRSAGIARIDRGRQLPAWGSHVPQDYSRGGRRILPSSRKRSKSPTSDHSIGICLEYHASHTMVPEPCVNGEHSQLNAIDLIPSTWSAVD